MPLKERITNNFSRYTASYDQYSNIQQCAARLLLAELPNEGLPNILEIGCGTGYYTHLLRHKYPQSKIKALDISPKMVAWAKDKLTAENIDFVVADAEETEFTEEYNLITANAVFHWFGDLEKTIPRYKKVLRANGRLAFSYFGPQTFCELRQVLPSCCHLDIPLTSDNFLSKTSLETILRKNFNTLNIQELNLQESFPALADLLKKIKYTGTNGEGLKGNIKWNKTLLKNLEAIYQKEFSQIKATSQIFICQASL
ncbi:MAG: methyltransferase domain-containing protein [Elusimicrobia bacterium]|nr:methyltransferase domain-containing protein [Elusimicrobiota bacterium]